MSRLSPLWLLLPVQAVLLYSNLGLLPAWTDELFTLEIAPLPPDRIVQRLAKDIHPPLYYFQVHLASFAAGPAALEAFRGISAAWGLALTALLDLLWVRNWKPARRWMALSLIALSPCVLLYARMARSYTMQATLALLAVWALRRWIAEPTQSLKRALPAVLACAALLYTHYVPGLAVLAGFCVIAIRKAGLGKIAAFVAAVLLVYAPWLWVLFYALSRWRAAPDFSSNYTLTGNVLTEQILKIGFGWTSLSIGETFPAFSLLLAVALFLLLVLAGREARARDSAVVLLVCVAAALGYLAVSRWVSYPFTPARLLWLLPFLTMAWAAGFEAVRPAWLRWGCFGALMISHAFSTGNYFQRRDFLNPGYSAPLREIAGDIGRVASPGDLVLMDSFNTDGFAVGRSLPASVPWMVFNEQSAASARDRARQARTVWIVRNTRDISPGKVSTNVEQAACAGREREVELWHPYAEWQKLAMRLMGIADAPTSFYRVTRCRAPG